MKRLVFFVIFFCLSFSALSQSNGDPKKFNTPPGNPACRFFDGFADNADGTVTDPRNGLVWKRCQEGFEWTQGEGCRKKNGFHYVDWFDAMKAAKEHEFLGQRNWRLPTKEELLSVTPNNDGCKSDVGAVSKLISNQAGDDDGFGYWSGTRDRLEYAWTLSFKTGVVDNSFRRMHRAMRFVRDNTSKSKDSLDIEADKKELDAFYLNKKQEADRKAYREKQIEDQERRRRSGIDGRSRGGVGTLRILDITKAYWVSCNNGYTDTFSRLDVSGEYCGRASNDSWKCFQQPSLTAQHICQ